MSNYANFSSNLQNDNLPDNKNSNMQWTKAFERDYDMHKTNQNSNVQILNDREMFNKFSNTNETIDTSSFNLTDSWGMPVQGGHTTNNKKSLLSTPYITESNNKNNWVSSSTIWNQNDMYAEIDFDKNILHNTNSNISNQDNALEMAYNNNLAGTNEDNGLCKIESDCLGFEYELTKQKQKEIVVDVSSPFALGYIWKTLILLSKNPSTDKIVKMLGIKSKDSIMSDMKRHAEVFDDSGKLEIIIPEITSGQTVNSNYISKIEDIYKFKIIHDNIEHENIAKINLNWNFVLEIPFYYQPKIINDYLIGYSKVKTKFFELTDVPIFLMIDRTKNIVCLEIPCASNMVLGFIYTPTRELVESIPYDLITQPKKPEIIAKKLIIPKLNRHKKSLYSKNFKDVLRQIHLGEVIYGTMYSIDIMTSIGLSIGVSKEIPKNKYEITKSFDDITINHKCFYYVKNNFIQNKILSTGMIYY